MADNNSFLLRIITPDRIFYENQVEMVEIQAQAILRMAEMVALELVAEEVVVCHVKEEKEDRV